MDSAKVGNPEYVSELRAEGIIGIFYKRANTSTIPIHVDIDITGFRTAVRTVLTNVLQHKLNLSRDQKTLGYNLQEIAGHLTNGVTIMLYTKLRSINLLDHRLTERYLRNPNVPESFMIPEPYVLALEQLGRFKVSGMMKLFYLSPTFPDNIAKFGCIDEQTTPWCPINYARAVDAAVKLGLRFSSVDLTVKMGSSWWLYRPEVVEPDNVQLVCPYPEENFSSKTAILAGLFCCDADGEPYNPIVKLSTLGVANYGTMARSLTNHFAVDVYNAIGYY